MKRENKGLRLRSQVSLNPGQNKGEEEKLRSQKELFCNGAIEWEKLIKEVSTLYSEFEIA